MRQRTENEHDILEEFLTVLSEVEQTAEIRRQVLVDHEDFSAHGLFRHLARSNPRGVNARDLEEFFRSSQKVSDPTEMAALCRQFDHNGDGVIDIHEFFKNVLSREESVRSGTDIYASLPPSAEVLLSLLKIFELEIEAIKTLDKLRELIKHEGLGFSLRFFEILDRNRKGFFDLKDVLDYLSRTGKNVAYSKANRIIKRLDRDLDNKVVLQEWELAIQPVMPSFYQMNPQDNIFNLLGDPNDHQRVANLPEHRPHFDTDLEHTGLPSAYYNLTPADALHAPLSTAQRPHERTVHTLVYSKSPVQERYNGADGALGSNGRTQHISGEKNVKTSPFRADVVLSKTVTEFANGTTQVEERVYDPEGARKYRHSLESQYSPMSESKYLIETAENPLKNSGYSQTGIRGETNLPQGWNSPNKQGYETKGDTNQYSGSSKKGLQHTYTYPDRERIVSSPNGNVHRHEVIYPRDPSQFGSTQSQPQPHLQQEIITRTERIVDGQPQTQTYVRKVYGSSKGYETAPIRIEDPAAQYQAPAPREEYTQELPKNFGSPERQGSAQKGFGKDSTFVHPDTSGYESRTKQLSGRKNPIAGGPHKLADTRNYADLVKSQGYRLQAIAQNKLEPNRTKFSALTSAERNQLLELFKSKVRLFREVERARRELAQHPSFSISELYRLVATPENMRTGIRIEQFRDLFEAAGIRTEDKTLRLIFVRHDYDNDSFLNFFEFSELLAPYNPDDRDAVNVRPENEFRSLEDLPAKLKQTLSRALSAVVDFELETDSLRASMRDQLFSLYNIINLNDGPAVTIDDFASILEQAGLFISQEELLAVIRKFDANLDGQVTLEEFINEMSPLRLTKPYEIIRGRGF